MKALYIPWHKSESHNTIKLFSGFILLHLHLHLYKMRLVYEALCWCSIAGITMTYELYGATGLAWFTLFQLAVVYADFYISPTAAANVHRAVCHGFRRSTVIAFMIFNLIGTNILVAWIAAPIYHVKLQIEWHTPLIILFNLAMSELCFTAAHTRLHRTEYGARLHHLHHCCKPSSWSSNLIIHPIDMAVEFSGPVLVLLFTDRWIFHNPTALFLSLTVLQLWYAVDHSEYLKLPHYRHHAYINNFLHIYLKTPTKKPGRDCVKALMNKCSFTE